MKIECLIRPVVGIAFCISLFLTGCSSLGFFAKKGAPEGEPRILPSDIARKEIVVARQELVRRLQESGVGDGVRLIPILKGQSYEGDQTPEYRIFGVKTQSVYQLLGLENADVIVSAHGFVIRDPRVFPEYVALLKVQPSGSIEIRRGSKNLLLAIKIKD